MTPIRNFRNNFGIYQVPLNVFIDLADVLSKITSSDPMTAGQFVGYANVNNALAFENYKHAVANSEAYSLPMPGDPKYWVLDPHNIDEYYNAVTANGTGFVQDVDPGKYGLPAGVGGSFIPALGPAVPTVK